MRSLEPSQGTSYPSIWYCNRPLIDIPFSLTEWQDFGHAWMRWGAASLTAFTLLSVMSVRFIRIVFFEFFLMSHIFLVG